MELFFVGTLVGIIASNVWSAFIRPLSRRSPPALPPGDDPPKLLPVRGKRLHK